MFYSKLIISLAAALPLTIGAQNLLKNGDAETELSNWDKNQVKLITEKSHTGKASFQTLGQTVVSSELIPVDTAKAYKISGFFKSADDKKTTVYLGLMPLDEKKIHIQAVFVNALADSETELAAPCKAEDTVLKVKDGSKWIVKDKYSHVAFEADKTYKDLPNSKITAAFVTKVEKNGDVWDVTLSKPCGKVYPANTAVRIQRDGATYMYQVSTANFQSSDWKELSGQVKGTAKSGTPGTQFWPGTKYVRVIILALNGGMICFDDIKLEETK